MPDCKSIKLVNSEHKYKNWERGVVLVILV